MSFSRKRASPGKGTTDVLRFGVSANSISTGLLIANRPRTKPTRSVPTAETAWGLIAVSPSRPTASFSGQRLCSKADLMRRVRSGGSPAWRNCRQRQPAFDLLILAQETASDRVVWARFRSFFTLPESALSKFGNVRTGVNMYFADESHLVGSNFATLTDGPGQGADFGYVRATRVIGQGARPQ